MNNLFIKRSVAFLTAIITSCSVTPCFSSAASEELKVINPQLEYAKKAIVTYLNSYDVNDNSIYLSQPYSVYNLDEENIGNDLYIIFEENAIIGMLSVSEIDGEFYSSFEYNSFDKLQDVYDNNESVSFVCSEEKLYVEESNTTYDIYDSDNSISYNFTVTSESKLKRLHKVENSKYPISTRVHTYQKNLPVPIVPNETINGSGICWAAVIASKHDYINNALLLASDVYNDLDEAYTGTPSGTPTWIQRGFNYYGISCTTLYRMLDCVEVYNNINENNPIYMSLTGSVGGHGVLLSGITINSDGSGIYRLVDSNRMSYADVIVPADVMTAENNFVYATNYGYTFTNWRWSFY